MAEFYEIKKSWWLSKWVIMPVIAVMIILALIAGSTVAYFSDQETSTGNTSTAWTSTQWTQTSQTEFENGVLTNVDTTTSPGDVQLSAPITSYSPSANTGNWTNGGNGYSSDNQYATLTPSTTVSTNNPSSQTGGMWTNPARAYTDGGTGYANITSGAPSGNNIWGNYGFSLATGAVITKVRVRYDAWATPLVAWRSNGTVGAATSGNVTPGLPTNAAVNDILICLIVSKDNVNSTMDAEWTAVDAGTNNGTGLRTTVFWARYDGAIVHTVTHTGGSYIRAAEMAFSGVITSGSPFDVNQATYVKTPTSTTNNFGNGMTTTVNNDLIVLLSGCNNNVSSATYTGSPTPTERLDNGAANYPRLIMAEFTLATAGATGARTSTIATSLNNGYQLSLKPATDYPSARVDVSWDGGTSWSSKQTQTLTTSETTYWYDVTASTAWTPAKLVNGQLQVRVDAQTATAPMNVNLDWLPVEVTYYNTTHTYSTYGISLTGNFIIKVEVGFEAFAASSEKVEIDVTWNNGTNWSSKQTSSALGSSDPNSTTWFDFTAATAWTPAMLNNTNFDVRIWYLNSGASGQVSLDYIPVRVTYRMGSGTIASEVLDTTVTGSGWDGLAWDSTGSITIYVRARDTSFLKAAGTPAWTSVGSTSPVISGLPAGQYKQWRANLTTSDTSTPTLSEVRLYYYGP